MSRTPLALIRGVKKLCKDLGVDPEDVRTFRFFTPPPPPHLPTLSCPCLFVCLFFPVLLMYGFLFHFCKTTLAMCMALQYKERSYYYYYYHLPVLEAHVQQQFFVHFFKPHFATEQSKTFMSLSWMLADLFLSFCLCRL